MKKARRLSLLVIAIVAVASTAALHAAGAQTDGNRLEHLNVSSSTATLSGKLKLADE